MSSIVGPIHISMLLIVTEVRSITERRHDIGVLCAVTHIFAYWTSPVTVTHVIEYLRPCALILLRLWRYISHLLTYLPTVGDMAMVTINH